MRTQLFRSMTWLMILVMSASPLFGQAAQAVLNSAGSVTVDGKPITQGAAIFSGQTVKTHSNSTAALNFQGSSVTLSPNTNATVGSNELVLGCGDALVTTTKTFDVRVGDLLITPAQGESAKFEVTQTVAGARIDAQQGTLSLSNGKILGQGQTDSEPGAGNCPRPLDKPEPIAAGGTNNGMEVLVGIGAAGAAATLLVLTVERNASPKCPNNCQ